MRARGLAVALACVGLGACDPGAIIGGGVPQDRIDLIKLKIERAIRVQDPGFRDLTAKEGENSSVEVCGMVEQRLYGESFWRPFYAELSVDDRMKLTTPTDTRPIEEAQQCFKDSATPGCGFGEYDRLGWTMTLIECPQFQ